MNTWEAGTGSRTNYRALESYLLFFAIMSMIDPLSTCRRDICTIHWRSTPMSMLRHVTSVCLSNPRLSYITLQIGWQQPARRCPKRMWHVCCLSAGIDMSLVVASVATPLSGITMCSMQPFIAPTVVATPFKSDNPRGTTYVICEACAYVCKKLQDLWFLMRVFSYVHLLDSPRCCFKR